LGGLPLHPPRSREDLPGGKFPVRGKNFEGSLTDRFFHATRTARSLQCDRILLAGRLRQSLVGDAGHWYTTNTAENIAKNEVQGKKGKKG
jgi:hypothetical protein